jgi:hypothetical protein
MRDVSEQQRERSGPSSISCSKDRVCTVSSMVHLHPSRLRTDGLVISERQSLTLRRMRSCAQCHGSHDIYICCRLPHSGNSSGAFHYNQVHSSLTFLLSDRAATAPGLLIFTGPSSAGPALPFIINRLNGRSSCVRQTCRLYWAMRGRHHSNDH